MADNWRITGRDLFYKNEFIARVERKHVVKLCKGLNEQDITMHPPRPTVLQLFAQVFRMPYSDQAFSIFMDRLTEHGYKIVDEV